MGIRARLTKVAVPISAKNNKYLSLHHLFPAAQSASARYSAVKLRGDHSRRTSRPATLTPMHKVFIEGGLIRKLGSVEMDAYRDHLLRLDAESRRNRFGAAIAGSHAAHWARAHREIVIS